MKLLVILPIIKLYAHCNIFKNDSETQEKDIPVTESYEYPKDDAQSDVQVEQTPKRKP